MSQLICYCQQAFSIQDFPLHAYQCQYRFQRSPIRQIVQNMVNVSSLEQLQVLLEELNLEYTLTEENIRAKRTQPQMSQSAYFPQTQPQVQPAMTQSQFPPNSQQYNPSFPAAATRPDMMSTISTVQCSRCNASLLLSSAVFQDCTHTICSSHVTEAFNATFMHSGEVRCPVQGCGRLFSHAELREIVGYTEFEKANTLLCTGGGGTDETVTCGKCSTTFLFEPGDIAANRVDSEGHKLSEEAAKHRSMYRLRCPVCTHISCRKCQVDPYHDGKTCEEFKTFTESKKCRYCDKVVGRDKEICEDAECSNRYQRSCKRVLPCGHRCYGTVRDETCPPCLHESCGHDPNEHELCSICYIEGLGMHPVVELECGHYLHSECLSESLKSRWSGPRITFTFARCPQCKGWALPKNHSGLKTEVEKTVAMFQQIQARSMEQLRLDKEDSNPRITDPSDKNYYRQPEKYAMDRYCFYECFQCKRWYYGGKKDCAQNDDGQKYEAKDLVCPSCSAAALGGQSACPTHGNDFIEYKCRFCCAVAAWFCWGTTHFCNDCHTKQNNKIYLNKMPKDQLPQCPGPAKCPLGIQHPPTGDEYPLGCAICRQERAPK